MQRFTVLSSPLAAAALALLTAAGSAQAKDSYAGLSIGGSKYRLDTTGATSADTTGTGFKLYAGHAFTPMLGAEVSVFDLGRARGAAPLPGLGAVEVKGRARGAALAAVLSAPLGDAAVFAKAGLAGVQGRVEARTPFGPVRQSESSAQPLLGAGASYAVTAQMTARAEWERVRVRYADDLRENTDLFSVGLAWRF